MEIHNATIHNVSVGLSGPYDNLCIELTFKNSDNKWPHSFYLRDFSAVSHLATLMKYSGVRKLNELEGKSVRIVTHNHLFRGFGHPTKDEFRPVGSDSNCALMTLSSKEFEKFLSNPEHYLFFVCT